MEFSWHNPAILTPAYHYQNMLMSISKKIRMIILCANCSVEQAFKAELEEASLLIDIAEKALTELKSLVNDDLFINGFGDLIAIGKFLTKNISFDFVNKTIDFYSLFRTFNEISFIVTQDPQTDGPSLCLSKRYALFWVYLCHIHRNRCTDIFGAHYRGRALIIYFILEFRFSFYDNCFGGKFYPNRLDCQFVKLYKNGSPQLGFITEHLESYNLQRDCLGLGISEKVSSFAKLTHFLSEKLERDFSFVTWRVRALAELESYTIRNGLKFQYSVNNS